MFPFIVLLQIMALLAPIIGKEKTGEFFLDKFLELCTSEHYEVRKMCAIYCPHLCKVMGIEISEQYLVSCIWIDSMVMSSLAISQKKRKKEEKLNVSWIKIKLTVIQIIHKTNI